jgi:hypothetical protein
MALGAMKDIFPPPEIRLMQKLTVLWRLIIEQVNSQGRGEKVHRQLFIIALNTMMKL